MGRVSWSKSDSGSLTRLCMSFSKLAKSRVAAMRVLTDAKNDVAVIRDALRLYDYVLQQRAEGWSLRLVKDDTAKEIVLMATGEME